MKDKYGSLASYCITLVFQCYFLFLVEYLQKRFEYEVLAKTKPIYLDPELEFSFAPSP